MNKYTSKWTSFRKFEKNYYQVDSAIRPLYNRPHITIT